MSSLYPVDNLQDADRCKNTRKNEYVTPVAALLEGFYESVWVVEDESGNLYLEYEKNLAEYVRWGD